MDRVVVVSQLQAEGHWLECEEEMSKEETWKTTPLLSLSLLVTAFLMSPSQFWSNRERFVSDYAQSTDFVK